LRTTQTTKSSLCTWNRRACGICPPPGIPNNQKTQYFGSRTCFRLHVRGGRHLLDFFATDPKRLGVCLHSLEDGKRSDFPDVVFSSNFEFWTMDKLPKRSDSGCYTPSSELYRFWLAAWSRSCLLMQIISIHESVWETPSSGPTPSHLIQARLFVYKPFYINRWTRNAAALTNSIQRSKDGKKRQDDGRMWSFGFKCCACH
jgi:hypothetical protein